MARKPMPFGDELIAAMQEALEHATGKRRDLVTHTFDRPALEVKRIREKTRLTQEVFAVALGVSASAVKKWERNARQPEGAARTLLQVMDMAPGVVVKALRLSQTPAPRKHPAPARRRASTGGVAMRSAKGTARSVRTKD